MTHTFRNLALSAAVVTGCLLAHSQSAEAQYRQRGDGRGLAIASGILQGIAHGLGAGQQPHFPQPQYPQPPFVQPQYPQYPQPPFVQPQYPQPHFQPPAPPVPRYPRHAGPHRPGSNSPPRYYPRQSGPTPAEQRQSIQSGGRQLNREVNRLGRRLGF